MSDEAILAISEFTKVKNISLTLAITSGLVAVGFTIIIAIIKKNE